MSTPHINAEPGAFAPIVLMPGDPLRARHIAETFLDDAAMVTNVRSMAGFTGTWKQRPVSVMASGMGVPSAAIYITELIRSYEVTTFIRVGTAGVYQPDLALRTVVAATDAVTNSSLPAIIGAPEELIADPDLVETAQAAATTNGIDLALGTVFTSDVFYEPDNSLRETHAANGVLCVEMETAALYAIAAVEGAKALTLLTMTDHLVTGEHLTSDERQLTVDEMIRVGLETALNAP